MKKILLISILICLIVGCSKGDPNAPTTFVFYTSVKDINFPNCVAGYFDKDGYCWKIAELGTIITGVYTPEITIEDDTITEIYLFTDYISPRVFRRSFPIKNNVKNIFELREDDYANTVDKSNPKQYPQEKGTI